jgi:hypothetical protein
MKQLNRHGDAVRAKRMQRVLVRVFATLVLSCYGALPVSFGADPRADAHGLIEVRALDQLPEDIASQLRRGKIGGRSYSRLNFILGGKRADYVLIAFEEYDPSFPVHAMALSPGPSGWKPTAEMILSARPHTLGELEQLIQSDDAKAITAEWAKREHARYNLLRQVQPSRRNGPFRDINLSDDEVREIQAAILAIMPGAILNISGVVSGCLCEDGPGCAAQAWVLAHRPGTPARSKDLEVSDINNHWMIGPVQQWYLDSEMLDAKHFPNYKAYTDARKTLDDQFPACVTHPEPASDVRR